MKINHKLIIAFTLVALFVILLGILSTKNQQELQDEVDIIYTSNIGEMRFTHEIAYHLQRAKSNLRLLILESEYGTANDRDYAMLQARNSLDELDEMSKKLNETLAHNAEAVTASNHPESLPVIREQQAQLVETTSQIKTLTSIAEQLMALYADGKHPPMTAAIALEKQMQPASREAQENIEKLEVGAVNNIATSVTEIRRMIIRDMETAGAVTLTAFLFAMLLAWIISRSIVRNITRLKQASARIGNGQLDTIIDIDTSDELGELAADINKMAANIEAMTVSRNALTAEIGERKRTEEALTEQKERAEKADRAKSEFLASMSHEIRTPLHGMLGIAEHLKESGLSREQRDEVETILASGGALLSLINDILDFSKIEAGQMELEATPFEPCMVVDDVARMLRIKAEEKSILLHQQLPGDRCQLVLGDPARLRQVLINLVGNAIKFTGKGGTISVALRMQEASDGKVALTFAVTDSGIGIPADRLDAIFDKFTQADSSTSREFGGTGIGLSICRDLIQLMGGTITVASQHGEGSTFTIELALPVARQAAAAPVTTGHDGDHSCLHGARILAADDNPVNCKVLQLHLKKMGCELELAANGQEAVEKVMQGHFQLVLMDMHMPVMDGLAATRAIRAGHGEWAQIPVIAMTANVIKGTREACIEAGMNDYLSKPAKPAELKAMLLRYLN
ncbi:response regulator [Mariprofundus erugo]|uniref:ATP-binding protein n=1 Tax=Mariprofundus erugo TaxID=2528639 RepID=UPI0010FF181D|nr:ATP-binding protein [Mariprofundus erugo]TLS74809.1 response regulator [Mariprofundus erugo]